MIIETIKLRGKKYDKSKASYWHLFEDENFYEQLSSSKYQVGINHLPSSDPLGYMFSICFLYMDNYWRKEEKTRDDFEEVISKTREIFRIVLEGGKERLGYDVGDGIDKFIAVAINEEFYALPH